MISRSLIEFTLAVDQLFFSPIKVASARVHPGGIFTFCSAFVFGGLGKHALGSVLAFVGNRLRFGNLPVRLRSRVSQLVQPLPMCRRIGDERQDLDDAKNIV